MNANNDRSYFLKHSNKHKKCAPYIVTKKHKKTKKLKQNTIQTHIDTCLDSTSIKALVKNYNKTHKTNIIKRNKPNIMLEDLKKKVYKDCKDNEVCIVNHKFVSPKLKMKLANNYKPYMPKKWYEDKKTWLNTLDIDAVFNQYEIKYPEFVFFGPTPIDFDKKLNHYQCVDDELCRINIPQLHNKGIKYIGIVFNLDPHNRGGSHWISLFCNLNKNEICFWDSYAHRPPKEVRMLMNKIKNQCKKIKKKMTIKITNNRHQYGNSECGLYSTHFIIKLLEGDSFEKLTKNRISDEIMNTYRSKYFLPL